MAPCRVDGCDKKCSRKEICEMHYFRFRRQGVYDIPNPRKKNSLREKFNERYIVTESC